mmetsp:Transcript_16339/g.67648  ORF Transcript_16339/g.67648 Transcript_16339/m.67648 type:complete len:81 (-) Transcript_16339:875-1117(-)
MELEEKELVRKYNKKFQTLFNERASCIDSSVLSHFWLNVLKKSKVRLFFVPSFGKTGFCMSIFGLTCPKTNVSPCFGLSD